MEEIGDLQPAVVRLGLSRFVGARRYGDQFTAQTKVVLLRLFLILLII